MLQSKFNWTVKATWLPWVYGKTQKHFVIISLKRIFSWQVSLGKYWCFAMLKGCTRQIQAFAASSKNIISIINRVDSSCLARALVTHGIYGQETTAQGGMSCNHRHEPDSNLQLGGLQCSALTTMPSPLHSAVLEHCYTVTYSQSKTDCWMSHLNIWCDTATNK